MKIYTKTGDHGTTSLMGGKRVEKSDLRIRAYGEVDELNSQIGLILADLADYGLSLRAVRRSNLNKDADRFASLAMTNKTNIREKLFRVQSELLVLGSDLATPLDVSTSLALRGASKIPRITKNYVTRLEKEIDKWTASLPALRNFILPGGGKAGAELHLARTVARRAERSIVDLSKSDTINKYAQIYVNRLSDWLFTLARYVNNLENQKETIWSGRK